MKNKHIFRLALIRKFFFSFSDFFYPPFSSFMPKQVYRYAFFGALNLALDNILFVLSYYVIFHPLAEDGIIRFGRLSVTLHSFCLAISMPIITFTGFLSMRFIVFDHSRKSKMREQLVKYIFSSFSSLLISFVFLKFFIEWLLLNAYIAKVSTTFIVIFYSFLFQTFITFRKKKTR